MYRWFKDELAIQILQDIANLKQDTEEDELVNEFLLFFARINNVDISTVKQKSRELKK